MMRLFNSVLGLVVLCWALGAVGCGGKEYDAFADAGGPVCGFGDYLSGDNVQTLKCFPGDKCVDEEESICEKVE